ncbi:hypothetical protein [Denitrobaculum tricleocarpae]|uniref:hypothetical protein n=1 Tax=Denitrobaculum tricleocarpae TaxID=2591009 RepID=UPI001FEC40D0|nr:hypothetical protein [Denitrobaculum tricleocarpae]
MTEENDTDELAKRFLDLWQDQAQAVAANLSAQGDWAKVMRDFGFPAADREAAESPAENLAAQWAAWPAMMAAAASVAKTAGSMSEESAKAADGNQDQDDGCNAQASRKNTPGEPAPFGTKAASASSGDGLHNLDQLLRRLDAIEERLAALESKQPRKR